MKKIIAMSIIAMAMQAHAETTTLHSKYVVDVYTVGNSRGDVTTQSSHEFPTECEAVNYRDVINDNNFILIPYVSKKINGYRTAMLGFEQTTVCN